MSITKTEGFTIPGMAHNPARPSFHRPFSDGSMTVETDLLASLMSGAPPQPQSNERGQYPHIALPYHFSQSMPVRQHSFDYSMPSPLSTGITLSEHFRAPTFNPLKFGNEHPEPPINIPTPASNANNSPNPQRRSSSVGKAPPNKTRQNRKSMNDVRPARGAIVRNPRTSSQGPHKPMALRVGLDTHVEGELTDSISPPEFGGTSFGLAIPRNDSMPDGASWGSGSVPSMVPGSFGSFDTNDDVIVDSPVTPVKPLMSFGADDSYKKQRRRECHNLVEKRRREHINAKIEELGSLLPDKYNQVEEPEEEDEEGEEKKNKKKKKKGVISAKSQKDAAHCKGRILTQSVNYIRDLRQMNDTQANRISQLEALLVNLGINSDDSPENHNLADGSFARQNHNSVFWLNGNDHNVNRYDNKEAGYNLQAMRPSPEPERPFPFEYDTRPWTSDSPAPGPEATNGDVYMPYEPSPSSTNNSREPVRRMSQSGSSDVDQNPLSPLENINRGRPRGRMRQDSQADLQVGMSGLFRAENRDDSSAELRW
ncbi:uncharacterized protein L203_102443 [Cryptococcus depauperatus CBS 7841]|uniref:BHLH domain-containing protein n=1 Tax=Cryptococcus depauperatus CBS 7841 TaxID=1295531 RepID=A0AAJ8JRY2_9TREE